MADVDGPGGPPTIFCYSCGAVMEATVRFCQECGAANPGLAQAASVENGGENGGPLRTHHIKYRNMWVQVLLFIITLSLYNIYWFFVTLEELYKANGNEDGGGCLWTILYVIPIANLFAYWHQGNQYERFINGKYPGIAIFILWIVFAPAVWFLVQRDLNAAAKGNRR